MIQLVCLVSGGVNGRGSFLPVDSGVGLSEPGESEDYVLLSAIHDVEENLVEYSSNVDIEGSVEMDVTSFVWDGVGVSYWDRVFKVGSGELMLLYEVPVYAGDLGSRVNEGMGVNIFQGA